MTTLTFKSKEFSRMMEFMRNHDRAIPNGKGGEPTKKFGLHLVKDDGIYLMSGTFESDKLNDKSCHVIYAQGFSPKTKDVWEKCRDAVGSDDFAEWIPLNKEMVETLEKNGHMKIKFTPSKITTSVYVKNSNGFFV
tara:strand:+ start:559 stop:966 length:408 start_codon:yes stop_codon:yes gene_type:complete